MTALMTKFICILSEPKNQFLIEKCENVGIKNLNDSSAFIECSNTMVDDAYNNIDNYNPKRKKHFNRV